MRHTFTTDIHRIRGWARLQRFAICAVVSFLFGNVVSASAQTLGSFQAGINYSAGPPTIASNTGFLFGGIGPVEAHTRDSNERYLDFNGDGIPDVVVAASCTAYEFTGCPQSGYAVLTYLGDVNGAFKLCDPNSASCAPPYGLISSGPQTYLRSIAVGDFNHDGKTDVVAASDCFTDQNGLNCGSGSIVILLGHGDGTFSTGTTYLLNGEVGQAYTITAGDFNGDNYPDVAVGLECTTVPNNGCSGPGAVAIYINSADASGTFSGPTEYQTVGNAPLFPVAGDFNNDGKLDIVAGSPNSPLSGNAQSSLTILVGSGTGTFTQQFFNGQPAMSLPFFGLSGIATLDVNSDNALDVAITAGSSQLQLLMGNGDATFSGTPVTYSTSLGNGLTNGGPIATADFNKDGKPDLIVSGTLDSFNGVQVLLNDGTGNLIPGASYTAGGWLYAPMDVADFNDDGKLDLVVVSGCAEDPSTGGQLCPDGTLTVLLGNSDGTMRSARYLTGGNSYGRPWSVAAADFNGDGYQDLVFPGCATGQTCSGDGITLLLSDGNGGYQAPLFFPSSATQGFYLAVADFDGDGWPDVALFSACNSDPYNCTGEAVSVFLNTGNSDPTKLFSAGTVYDSGGSSMAAQSIAIGDFDSKNGSDIALLHCCTNDSNNLLSVLINNGDGTFGQAVTQEVANATGSWIAAADFNHDGKADLAVAEYTNDPYGSDPYAGLVEILIGKGDGTFSSTNTYSSLGDRGGSGNALTVSDLNGDGNADIVVGNSCDQHVFSSYVYDDINCARGAIGVLLGDGNGNFQPSGGQSPNPAVVPDANFSGISIADVNGDGTPDVVASTLTGIYVTFGNGDGTFQPGMIYAGLRVDQNVQLAVADLNNDGGLDIVQPGDNSQFAILYNQGPANSLIATTTSINAPAITYGDTASITVSVNSGHGPVTGSVSLAVDNNSPMNQPLVSGSATFSIPSLGGGSHTLTASYAAQGSFGASSASGALQVNQAQPTVSFTGAPASATYNSTFVVAATTNASTSATIFAAGACSVAGTTVTMTSGSGTCNLTASWAADNNYLDASAMQSTTASLANTSITITSHTPSPSVVGQPVTVIFAVTGNGTPTGNVTVSDGGGDTCSATVGTAQCVLVIANAGNKSLVASYAGDGNFSASTSAGVAQSIVDCSILATPSSQTIRSGQKTSYKLGFMSQNGFSGTVALSCTLPASGAACSVPSSVAVTSRGTTSKLNVQTSKSTPKGTYSVTVKGIFGSGNPTTGGLTRNVSVSLIVN